MHTFPPENQLTYQSALREPKADLSSVDFVNLRQLYAEDADYKSLLHLTSSCTVNEREILEAHRTRGLEKAINHTEAILAQTYLDIDAHSFIAELYGALAQEELAHYHRRFTAGLLVSILASGDGLTPETAYHVITKTKQWSVLAWLGYQPGDRSRTIMKDGFAYTVLKATHGLERSVPSNYDVSRVFEGLRK